MQLTLCEVAAEPHHPAGAILPEARALPAVWLSTPLLLTPASGQTVVPPAERKLRWIGPVAGQVSER
jgi:hypothetical protein